MIEMVSLCYTDEAKGSIVEHKDQEEGVVTIDDLAIMIARGFREIDEKFARIDMKFAQMDRRMDSVDERFDQVDQRFNDMDRRFDRIEGRQEIQQRTLEFHEMRLRTGNL